MSSIPFNDGVTIGTSCKFAAGCTITGLARSVLTEESLSPFAIPMTAWRIHDAIQTPLTGTAGTDDLCIKGNTFGTGSPSLQSSDGKATTITQYARCEVPIPMNFNTGSDLALRFRAGMNTTVSDGTATLDCSAYLKDEEAGITGADLVSTSAVSINSLTFGDVTFVVASTSVVPGSVLDVRIAIAITDTATGTSVIGEIGSSKLLADTIG